MKRRLFIGIDLSQDIKIQIKQTITQLKQNYPQVKWENIDKLHLTLKFLGYTKTDPAKIWTMLGQQLNNQPSFKIEFGKIGVFNRRPTVIFIEIKPNVELNHLFTKIETAMKKLNFPKESRSFHPHVTIGRSKTAIIDKIEPVNIDLPLMTVAGLVLFESRLSKAGSIYTHLREIELLTSKPVF